MLFAKKLQKIDGQGVVCFKWFKISFDCCQRILFICLYFYFIEKVSTVYKLKDILNHGKKGLIFKVFI